MCCAHKRFRNMIDMTLSLTVSLNITEKSIGKSHLSSLKAALHLA